MDPLTEPFAGLCHALRGMRDQVQELVKVHESIDAFNSAFGDFQDAMALHASCLQFPKQVKKVSIHLSSIPPPQVSSGIPSLSSRLSRESSESSSSLKAAAATASGASAATGTGKSRNSSTGNKGKKSLSMGGGARGAGQQKRGPGKSSGTQKRKAPPPPSKRQESPAWKWDKHIRDLIPRKYQSNEELKKLENILLYMKNRRSGITIADLVKHSGLAVIKSKEILQTLMKVDLIHREHEKSGFVYTFGSAQ